VATDRQAGGMERRPRGFSAVEAVVSVLILSLAIVSSLHAYGTYAKGALIRNEAGAAHGLAAELIAEIASQAYEEPGAAVGTFGTESGESTRASFDDVDDYDGWSENPPTDRAGTALTDYAAYARSVTVTNVDEATLSSTRTDGSTGAKRIVVTVTCGGKLRARLEAIRMRVDEAD